MKGLVVKYGEKTYKVGLPDGGVTLSSCIMQNKFTLEAGGSPDFVTIKLSIL